MGKRRRLNKLISKWIKRYRARYRVTQKRPDPFRGPVTSNLSSDLPDDCSSVLLLSVTRTPPSPKSKRRPFSLPHALGVVSSCSKAQVRRNSSSGSNGGGRRPSVTRRDSIRRGLVAKGERPGARPPKQEETFEKYDSQRDRVGDVNAENGEQLSAKNRGFIENGVCLSDGIEINQCVIEKSEHKLVQTNEINDTTSLGLPPIGSRFKVIVVGPPQHEEQTNIDFIKKVISDRRSAFLNNSPDTSPIISRVLIAASSPQRPKGSPVCNKLSKLHYSYTPHNSLTNGSRPPTFSLTNTKGTTTESPLSLTPSPECPFTSSPRIGEGSSAIDMETSVDSIGTCSLDMETSRELPSDWSEASSTRTLCSGRFLTTTTTSVNQEQQHHLPSYLSLACTVNGYSTTTNYDPVRLARSRDASPHRVEHGSYMTGTTPQTYNLKNNLLSPPNLVPLPTPKVTMTENALRARHHQEFYSSTKTMTFLSSKESHFSSNIFAKDNTDGCLDNTHRTIQRKCVTTSYESKNVSNLNDQSNCTIESSSISKEFTNGKETKSFIQQRVERLYGPGALAQGFFVSKRQKDRLSESDDCARTKVDDKHNKTLPDKLSDQENIEPTLKQSSSSPSLPVLRHLRPEFRAQLPIASAKKTSEGSMQKSMTVPKLTDEAVKVNGHAKSGEASASDPPMVIHKLNGSLAAVTIKEESNERDGHHFLRILDEQTDRLLALADKTEQELETPDLSEEVIGKIRSASGKARLLVSQKMQQFKGLCTNNINQRAGEAFPTTNEDLQGFWDMVMLQVDQVDRLFEEINRLKENNWIEETVKPVENMTNGTAKTKKVIAKPKLTAANEEARKQREEQRKKMIEERRKAMKAAQKSNSQSNIEIFVPESS